MIRLLAISGLSLTLLAVSPAAADEPESLGDIGQFNPGRDTDDIERDRDRRSRDRDGRRENRRDRRRDDRRHDRREDRRDDRSDRERDRDEEDDQTYLELYDRGQTGDFGRDGKRELDKGLDRLDPDNDRYDDDNDRDRRHTERDLDGDRDRNRDRERDRDEYDRAEPGLGHKVIAGLWTGEVEEVGAEPYTIRLSLSEDGSGTAAYSRLNCASEMVPLAGKPLEYRETITMGRETCDDGYVQLRLRKGLLLWSWTTRNGEVRAAATLKRDAKADVEKDKTADE